MSHRGPRLTREVVGIRLIDDPKVTARFQIQEEGEHEQWLTLRMFSNEQEARTVFEAIKKHGMGVRVLETAKAPIT